MSHDTATDDAAGVGADSPILRDLPPPPSSLWPIVGPGVVASGVGLSSGEFVLWPYIASQVGLVFPWGAVLGVVTQFFIGMGQYVPRLVSPITGSDVAAPRAARFAFAATPANMARWQAWWRLANVEQAVAFAAVTVITIGITSMLAHALLSGQTDLPTGIAFLGVEGVALRARVGRWFAVLFWLVGAFSLFTAAMGIVDYTSRLAADVLVSTYVRRPGVSESRVYFWIVWALVGVGVAILGAAVDQPLVLLVISASVGGTMMCVYSALLIALNRRHLTALLRPSPLRVAVLVWSCVLT